MSFGLENKTTGAGIGIELFGSLNQNNRLTQALGRSIWPAPLADDFHRNLLGHETRLVETSFGSMMAFELSGAADYLRGKI